MAINALLWPYAAVVTLNGWHSLEQGWKRIAHIQAELLVPFLDLEWPFQEAKGAERGPKMGINAVFWP